VGGGCVLLSGGVFGFFLSKTCWCFVVCLGGSPGFPHTRKVFGGFVRVNWFCFGFGGGLRHVFFGVCMGVRGSAKFVEKICLLWVVDSPLTKRFVKSKKTGVLGVTGFLGGLRVWDFRIGRFFVFLVGVVGGVVDSSWGFLGFF